MGLKGDGPRAVGGYRLLAVLGRGRTGITYEAESSDGGPYVAMKELRVSRVDDREVLERFGHEARVLAHLMHPAVPAYVDYLSAECAGETAFYLVQHLAPGRSLAELVAGGWRADEDEALRVAEALLDVLDYLHARVPPVFHRDLTPKNVIREDGGKLWLVDFGSLGAVHRGTVAGGGRGGAAGALPAGVESDLDGLATTLLFILGALDGQGPESSRARVSSAFASWLQKMREPPAADRFTSARQALIALRARAGSPAPRGAERGARASAGTWGFAALALVALVAAGVLFVPALRASALRVAAAIGAVRPIANAAPGELPGK